MRLVAILIASCCFAQTAIPRADANSRLAHEQLLAKRTQGRIDVYFEGDSITNIAHQLGYFETIASWRLVPELAQKLKAMRG